MEEELTGSLKTSIFATVPTRFPAFKVSPAHGRASIVFSFFLSFIESILSHPLVTDEAGGGAAASVSEKIAIFCFLGLAALFVGVNLDCGCC